MHERPERPRYQTTDDVEARYPGQQPPSGPQQWPGNGPRHIRPVPPGGTFHAGQAPKSRKNLAIGLMIGGALVAIAGFLTMNTQLVLAYKGGTLANVHGLCQNPFAVLGGQNLIHECAAINSSYTLAEVALWGGLVVGVAGLILLIVLAAQRRPA